MTRWRCWRGTSRGKRRLKRRPPFATSSKKEGSMKTTKGYLIRRLQDAPTVPCPCGESTRPLTRADTDQCNLHVTFIQDSVRHYHRDCTEVYLVLEGVGQMELDGDV